jgi:putative transposase
MLCVDETLLGRIVKSTREGLMFSTTNTPSSLWRFSLVARSFLAQPGLAFAGSLSEERIERAFACDDDETAEQDVDQEDVVYTPAVTLWAFLSQMLHADEQRSCLAAVARVAVLWLTLGKRICASNSGAFCRARAKVSEAALERLWREVADDCERDAPENWRWCGRRVLLGDGTTVSLPDTPENQAAYPQHNVQKPGLGFPIARLVVLFSLATGLLHEMAIGRYSGKETGEPALLRDLFSRFQPGDVFLADRCYAGWFLIALLQELGVDVVVRLHQLRDADFQKGQRLGAGDHVVEWPRPPRPEWMDEAIYARMPSSLQVREVKVQVAERGFRVESLVVVTTLLDAERYPASELAKLYRQRWLVELNIRTLKETLHLDVLRCKTPEMARKELRTGLLAYNLIRQTMVEAAIKAERSPRDLSFTAAMQTIAASWMVAAVAEAYQASLIELRIEHMASHRVGNRPDRVEPRAVKRRPKPHHLLTVPRDEARAKLLAPVST